MGLLACRGEAPADASSVCVFPRQSVLDRGRTNQQVVTRAIKAFQPLFSRTGYRTGVPKPALAIK